MGELFEEQDFQTLFMDILIFISGQEVSGSLSGSVSYSYVGNDGFNTATFTLVNPLNQFVLTKDNLAENESGGTGTWTLDGMYDESIKKAIFEYKRDNALNVADPNTNIKRWPLQIGDLIFNKHDPVRIFMHDPRTEEDSWFPVFAGFIDDPGKVGQDYLTGASDFQITCYDIRGLMQKMRVQMNPVVGLIVPELIVGGEEFFADFIVTDQTLTHPFANNKFEEVIEQLVVGSLDGGVLPKPQQTGVGEFNLGQLPAVLGVAGLETEGPDTIPFDDVGTNQGNPARWKVRFNPDDDNLEPWNDLILFGTSLEPWDRAKVETWGRTTLWDGLHSPAKQKLYILLPEEGNTGANNLVTFQHAKGGGDQRDWQSRFQVVSDLVDILDYNWIISGSGDMMFEFPMWDFVPNDFGLYSTSYTISKHLIEDDLAEEAGEVTTVLTVTGGIQNKDADFIQDFPDGLIPRAIVASPTMITKYGAMSQHPIPFPFTINLDGLMALALVEFQKRLSNIGEMTMKFSWRPFILLNRPLLNEQRNRMATITEVTNTIYPNALSEVDVTLRYLRRPDDDGNFRLLTGGTELAASYRRRWADPFNNQGTGIRTYPDTSSTKAASVEFVGTGIQDFRGVATEEPA